MALATQTLSGWAGMLRACQICISLLSGPLMPMTMTVHSCAESYQPSASGWEPNEKRAMKPRCMNLAAFLDPRQLAESAVDLNLRLMRWRVADDGLDLDRLAAAKCLLLGAGAVEHVCGLWGFGV